MTVGRGVPQFPGRGPTGVRTQHAWEGQMCPIMTVAEVFAAAQANLVAAEPSRLVGASALPQKKTEVVATSCQGPRCAFFVSVGAEGAGSCALAIRATMANNQNLLLEAIALKMGAIEPVAAPAAPTQNPPSTPS